MNGPMEQESSPVVALLAGCVLASGVLLWTTGCGGGTSSGHADDASRSNDDGHDHAGGGTEEGDHADEVTLSAAAIEAEGLVLERAAQRVLRPSFRAPARIAFNGDRLAHVGCPVRGRVTELRASLGDQVEQGVTLLVVDSPELGEAQSDYVQRVSALGAAAPAVALAQNSHERARQLYDENQGLPLSEVQRREAELRAAEAALRTAETAERAARNRLMLLGLDEGAIDRLGGTGGIDPRYLVRAPIAGQVIEREVTLGELVSPDREALLVLADLSHLWILADVPDGRLGAVRIGAPARVHLGASEDHWCDGTVAYISPAVDPATRTAQVRIEANDRHPELRPGVFAQAEIVSMPGDGAAGAPVLAVPQSAVQMVENASSVFVAVPGEPGTFARRPVTVGKPVGGFVQVFAGLEQGEEVVVRGAFLLKAELGKASAEHQH
jgi:cobalt-zinc-cadmium efflux system membrane fusion protein